jgi:hypothetical protein
MSITRSVTLPVALVVALTTGCEQDPTELEPGAPSMADVAGQYTAEGDFAAVSFFTDDGDLIVDWLAEGARLDITLLENGTTTGELYIPVPDDLPAEDYFEPEDVAQGFYLADLQGTWTLQGQTVRFDHPADTFIRDMDFLYNDGTLTGDRTWSFRIQVVLSRS